jgi:hypothetical protein
MFSIMTVLVLLALASGFVGFGFEQERSVHDYRLSALQTGEHFNFAAEVPTSAYVPDLERVRRARNEGDPVVSDPLHSRGRDGKNLGGICSRGNPSARRHARSQQLAFVMDVHSHRDGSRLWIDLFSDQSDFAGKGASWQSGESRPHREARFEPHRVTLESLNREPQVGQISDSE